MDKAWISTKEACDYLDITWATLKRYILEGKVEGVQIAVPKGKWRISVASINKLMGS